MKKYLPGFLVLALLFFFVANIHPQDLASFEKRITVQKLAN
jgi:hypothetical protein